MKGNRATGRSRPATHEDAMVVLELAHWTSELGMTAALSFLWADDFPATFEAFRARCPSGSVGGEQVLMIFRFYETVGTLWKHDLVAEALLFDWLAIAPVWERLKEVALGHRVERPNEYLWANFEAAALAQAAGD